jgi:hypothetical protein
VVAPVLLWLRRDLRLADHPALRAAMADGPVIPVFVLDPETEALGAASRWRLGLGLAELAARLEAKGSRLVLRRGAAAAALPQGFGDGLALLAKSPGDERADAVGVEIGRWWGGSDEPVEGRPGEGWGRRLGRSAWLGGHAGIVAARWQRSGR